MRHVFLSEANSFFVSHRKQILKVATPELVFARAHSSQTRTRTFNVFYVLLSFFFFFLHFHLRFDSGEITIGDTLQKRKNERYRLRIVVEELQNATAEDYRTALLAFINCLVISTPVLKDRIRIRNEFIG